MPPTELAMLAAMGGVLGSPNTRIWPSVGRLPGWTTLQLPDQPHNHLKQVGRGQRWGRQSCENLS